MYLDQADAPELLKKNERMDGGVLNLSGRINLLVDQRGSLTEFRQKQHQHFKLCNDLKLLLISNEIYQIYLKV